jgi:beta-lactamase regulating signal transducer with metallopeptidase domain
MTEVLRLVSHPLAVRMSFALLHFLWQGAALAGLALLLLAVLRKAPAGARYLALLAVFAIMALCPLTTFLLLGRAPAAPPPVAAVPAPGPAVPTAVRPLADQAPLAAAPILPPAAARPVLPAAPAPRPRLADLSGRLRPALPWMSVLWVLGVVALSLRLLLRWWVLRRVGRGLRPAEPHWQEVAAALSRRLRMSRPVRLMVSAAVQVPMVLGWLRPVIVLPATALTGLTADQLTALLAHELAHLRRHDQWVNVLQTVVELLLFYHPAVWWLSRALRAEREHCCDDIAVALSGDAPSYIRALAWVDENRDTALRPALAASGSPLLRRIRRLAGLPAPAELRPTWLAAALSLALAVALPLTGAVSRAAVADSEGHRPGLRDQWQPQTEHDARLSQPVHIEILGRAAVPALEMLSKQTGVTLQVAPENLDTVGERKLTVIAQGCSLKSIMVQIPNALQECHWDVDLRGGQPVYLLHRNAGVETTMVELAQAEAVRRQDELRPAREARLAQARAALAMSPEELQDLMETDPFLAAQVEDPEARHRLELLLGLPGKDMKEFLATGRAYLPYETAPEAYREAARMGTESFIKDAAKSDSGPISRWVRVVWDMLPQAGICFEDYDEMGVSLVVQYYNTSNTTLQKGDVLRAGGGGALPPRLPDEHTAKYWYGPNLLKAGIDEKALDALIGDQAKQRAEQQRERRDQRRALEWHEPRSQQLHKVVTLPFKEKSSTVDVQQWVARETGLSVVSDYFTTWEPRDIPDEAKAPMAMWRLLYVLGDSWFWSYDWDEAGDCLVFHDRVWYVSARMEFPESMVLVYREKLKQQGGFTLDDVAEAAVELARRRPVPPRQRGEGPWSEVNVPLDLEGAGLSGHSLRSEALLLYASLSPAQRERARSADGLSFTEMTPGQQDLVRPLAFFEGGWNHDTHPIPDGEIPQAVFRVTQSRETQESEQREMVVLQVDFPSLASQTGLWLQLPKQP